MCVMQGPCEVVGLSYWALLCCCVSLNAPLGLPSPVISKGSAAQEPGILYVCGQCEKQLTNCRKAATRKTKRVQSLRGFRQEREKGISNFQRPSWSS